MEQELRAEIARQGKVIRALMDRAERSTQAQGSDFAMFQTTIMLEELVRRRTEELEAVIRENEKIHRALAESEVRFRGLVNQSLVGIATIEDDCLTYANPKLAGMFGYTVEEIVGLPILCIATNPDRPVIAEQMRRRLSGEAPHVEYTFHGLRKDGAVLDVECHSSVMDIGGRIVLISLMIDVTERVRAEREVRALQDQLREQAIHDPLTGLYNRLPLGEFFDRELSQARRHHRQLCLVMGDLDHFKAVNDTYGHPAGDEVLRLFAGMVRHSFRSSDILCRYGGEEFLILLPDTALEVACERAEQVRRTLEETQITCGSSLIHLTASFGVAAFPEHDQTREGLISAADRALYAAKNCGRNRIERCSASMDGQPESRPDVAFAGGR